MPFRQLSRRDWSAAILELLLIIVGIFIAFQVDRWNEGRQLRAAEDGYVRELFADFEATRVDLQDAIDYYQAQYEAAEALFALEPGDDLAHAEFYATLDRIAGVPRFEPVRRTYDVLIASGLLDVIRDRELQSEMAAFVARLKFLEEAEADNLLLNRTSFVPYVNRALDPAALVKQTHPDEAANLSLARPADQFLEVLGDEEFRAVLVTKWHAAYDLHMNYSRLMTRLVRIQSLLSDNLPEG